MISAIYCDLDEYDKYIGKLVRIVQVSEYATYYYQVEKKKGTISNWTEKREEGDIFIVPSSYCLLEHLGFDIKSIYIYTTYLEKVKNKE